MSERIYLHPTTYNISENVKHVDLDDRDEIFKFTHDAEADNKKMILFRLARENRYDFFVNIINCIDVDIDYNLLLRIACDGMAYQIIKYLILNGADVHTDEDYAIKRAVCYNDYIMVKLLGYYNADLTTSDNYPLIYASYHDNAEIVQYLIDNGVSINASRGYALRSAVLYNNVELVRYLLSSGACIKNLEPNIIHQVVRQGSIEMIEILSKYHVNFTVINNYEAKNKNISKVLIKLIRSGVNPEKLMLLMADER